MMWSKEVTSVGYITVGTPNGNVVFAQPRFLRTRPEEYDFANSSKMYRVYVVLDDGSEFLAETGITKEAVATWTEEFVNMLVA